MPLDPIKNYQLDQAGVIVDQDPILAPPGALTKAQNATNDLYGEHGSLRKRPGLANFNTTATANSVLGGIGVPILLGSAGPIIGNPFAGEAVTIANLTAGTTTQVGTLPIVTGSGTTFDDASYEYGWDSAFDFSEIPFTSYLDIQGYNNTQQLDVTADNKTIQSTGATTTAGLTYFGGGLPSGDSGGLGNVWVMTPTTDASQIANNISNSYTGTSFLVFPTNNIRSSINNSPFFNWFAVGVGSNSGGAPIAVSGNIIYYTTQAAPLSVRAFDGFHDTLACTLPTGVAVMSLYGANGVLYITSIDVAAHGAAGGNGTGSAYQFTPTTGLLQRLGAQFPTGHVPYSMTWAYDRLFVGTALQEPATDATAAKVYWIRPSVDTAFTLDKTFASHECMATSLATFQGQVYAATINNTTAANVTVNLYVRSTAGVWTVSDSQTTTGSVGSNGTSGYWDLLVWPMENGPVTSPAPTLYASSRITKHPGASDIDNAILRKLSGGSWSTAYTDPSSNTVAALVLGSTFVTDPSTNSIVPTLWADNSDVIVSSKDGTTFTNQVSKFPASYLMGGVPTQRRIAGILIQVAH